MKLLLVKEAETLKRVKLMRNSMAKKKKIKKVKHICDGDCNNCPNFGTKNCEMFANKYKGKKKRKKKKEIRDKIIDSSLRTLLKCNKDCDNCPNFGTKDCVMIKNKRTKELNRKKKIIKKIIGKPDKKHV